jgi:hypothetical protein
MMAPLEYLGRYNEGWASWIVVSSIGIYLTRIFQGLVSPTTLQMAPRWGAVGRVQLDLLIQTGPLVFLRPLVSPRARAHCPSLINPIPPLGASTRRFGPPTFV